MKWNQVCQTMQNGGLGIKNMRAMNDALLEVGLGSHYREGVSMELGFKG